MLLQQRGQGSLRGSHTLGTGLHHHHDAAPPAARALRNSCRGGSRRMHALQLPCSHTRAHPRCPPAPQALPAPGSDRVTGGDRQHWVQRAAAAGLAVIMSGTSALCPAPPSLAAAAVGTAAAPVEAMHEVHMQHDASGVTAQPGTMAAQFSCTPLTTQERAGFLDLRGFTHKIHTRSPEAQMLFDQGTLLAYNFNRPEATRSFQAGLELDPDAAMLHWGLAHAQGPYANKVWGPAPPDGSYEVMTPQELALAQQEAQAGLAAARAALAAAPDDPLLQAELRYLQAEADLWGSVRDSGDRRFYAALEKYAQQLEAVGASSATDPDAYALAAEARMNLSPWVHWKGPLGKRVPVNAERVVLPALKDIVAAFDAATGHPMAAHLSIHLTEAATPGSSADVPAELGYAALGEAAADYLATGPRFPSMGHLVHMPSHTYLRVGRWHDAVTSNKAALASDEAIVKRCVNPYMPEHNSQLLIYAAMNSGELGEAMRAADTSVAFPRIFGPQNMADGRERVSKPLIQVRFASWGPLLQLQLSDLDYSNDGLSMLPPSAGAFGRGVFHFARAMALASGAAHESGAAAEALEARVAEEVSLLQEAVRATPPDPITRPGEGIGIFSPGFKRLGEIELLAAQARTDLLHAGFGPAATKLRAAIRKEQEMGYTEPPRQYQPMRECLAWVLLQQGKLAEAEKVYLQDLAELPNNPWSLTGLQQVYSRQGPQAASKQQQVEARLAASWSHADPGLTLSSSCPSFSD